MEREKIWEGIGEGVGSKGGRENKGCEEREREGIRKKMREEWKEKGG